MCSIVGTLEIKTKTYPSLIRKKVSSGLQIMSTRGPDESNITQIENGVMGGNRLIINGYKGDESMPYRKSSDILYYNGEIYNYGQWDKNASPDGRVILPLYKKYGYQAFSMLDGEFAISLWDNDNKSIVLARDQLGTKPLYFSLKDGNLIWASSEAGINEVSQHNFCKATKSTLYNRSFAIQEPYTSYEGIWLLQPGHYLVANASGVTVKPYNTWGEANPQSSDTTELFKALDESLKSRLTYSGTIAILMSGGIDSGIVAFTADKLKIDYELFCITDIFGKPTYEKALIKKRVKRLKNCSKVHFIEFTEQDYQNALIDVYAPNYYNSEYFDAGIALVHKIYSKISKRGIKVAVDGTGGDELGFGYGHRDDYAPVYGFPQQWYKNPYLYAVYTTLLDFTAKVDRAGSFFSIESRFPLQSASILNAMLPLIPFLQDLVVTKKTPLQLRRHLAKEYYLNHTSDKIRKITDRFFDLTPKTHLKWMLRKYLLELDYGAPLSLDLEGKRGFPLRRNPREKTFEDYKNAWLRERGLQQFPMNEPIKYPFI